MAIEMPSTIRFGTQVYTLGVEAFVPDLDEPCTGLCDYRTQSITIDPTIHAEYQRLTVMHEVLHPILQRLEAIGVGERKQEQVAEVLDGLLLSVLRDNPALVAYLMEGA